ncbi:MAG: Fur family transcriptional regulator [Candidatus Nanopelagicales bacterium]|jgi:Fur family ferric uptake transcriptional regulator
MSLLRNTKQRQVISNVLANLPGFISAQALHQHLAEAGESIGLATVYRTLQSMSEIGLIDVVRDQSGEMLFRACQTEHHHHHLVCRRCGAAEELQAGEVEAWAAQLAGRYGYQQLDHQVEIFGICPNCQLAR